MGLLMYLLANFAVFSVSILVVFLRNCSILFLVKEDVKCLYVTECQLLIVRVEFSLHLVC